MTLTVKKAARESAIVEKLARGDTLVQIAAYYDVSITRIRQIIGRAQRRALVAARSSIAFKQSPDRVNGMFEVDERGLVWIEDDRGLRVCITRRRPSSPADIAAAKYARAWVWTTLLQPMRNAAYTEVGSNKCWTTLPPTQ